VRGSTSDIGTVTIAKNGYSYTKTEDGWRATHYLVMEEKLGRAIQAHERVVFVDGDRANLDPSNLAVKRKTTASLRQKEKQILKRIEELQADLEEVRTKIKQLESGLQSSNEESN
jgi:hypothetical protein